MLQFSKTSGFRHEEAIPTAAAAVERIASRRGWQVFASENAAVFNDEQLRRFDVVFANNTTGDNWTDDQKAAFVRFMENGGGFVGVHGASGTRYRYWDWYTDALLRGRFIGHPNAPQIQETTVFIEDRRHPATRHLPAEWNRSDEWYSFEQSARAPGVRVLATLDEARYSLVTGIGPDLAMGDDHPIVWSHCLLGNGRGDTRGRAFYSAIGHTAEAYADTAHDRMLEGAIAWAAGLEGEC